MKHSLSILLALAAALMEKNKLKTEEIVEIMEGTNT